MTPEPSLGVDIGGTKTIAALIQGGDPGPSHELPTPASDGADAVLASAVELALAAAGDHRIDHVGVGAAGVIDHSTGRVLSATTALPGWQGTDVQAAFKAAFPNASVQVVNDVQAFTLAEWLYGAGRGASTVLGVTAGTGIGGALIIGGTIHCGATYAAGHIGHVLIPGAEGRLCPCGKYGHLEAVASGTAMTERYRELGRAAETLRDVAHAASTGDVAAHAVLDQGADALGAGLGSIANVLDPDVIVLGGGVARLGARWLERVRTAANAVTIPAIGQLRIEESMLGNAAVAVGASCTARGRGPRMNAPLAAEGHR
ncbi:ROK family protein [Arthrobacter sp. H5]|uniref:ROK family protein n=1 Tax=Arthrobacter sp. H5 TaxID=1267973 RepID=UPI0004ACB90E|nr:ROK family protein [Arthrobacter sp. H5]